MTEKYIEVNALISGFKHPTVEEIKKVLRDEYDNAPRDEIAAEAILNMYETILSAIKNFPAAIVRPDVHATWKITTEDYTPKRVCTNCGSRYPLIADEFGTSEKFNNPNYCDECGATMLISKIFDDETVIS